MGEYDEPKKYEKDKEILLKKRVELKERFLREELSIEEYKESKRDIEEELEKLESEKEEKPEQEAEAEPEAQANDRKKTERAGRLKSNSSRGHKAADKSNFNSIHDAPEENKWKYISIMLMMALIISIGLNLNILKSPFLPAKSNIAKQSVNYINTNLLKDNAKASIISVGEKSGVYSLGLDINGEEYNSYATKDGNLFFPTAIDMRNSQLANPANPPVPSAEGANANAGANADAAKLDISTDDDASIGPSAAPVTIVEFSDYQCPFCARAEPTIKQIMDTYKNKVRFVYRDFPLSFHQYAQKAAEASECADEQGKFWKYHDILFEKQPEWSSAGIANLKDYAKFLGLDTKKFNDCLDSGKYAAEVQNDYAEGQKYGVSGTPAFFINGIEVSGAQPFEAFQQIIEQELSK